ncbi:MAG: DUF3990 domain-containing protein [Ruminococcus sp.]
MGKITLYHGSNHIIKTPKLTMGKKNNDYGQGFYCTEDLELAKEWACKQNSDGFVNVYSFYMGNLKTLNLNDDDKTILNWIAVLLQNRTFNLDNDYGKMAREYLIDNFYINTKNYDVVTGYRADDSYFNYAESFVANGLPVKSLAKALKLGKLGEQIALVSEKAFKQIEFVKAIPVDKTVYFPKFSTRDKNARKQYKDELSFKLLEDDDIFIMDIIRQRMKNDDPRLR